MQLCRIVPFKLFPLLVLDLTAESEREEQWQKAKSGHFQPKEANKWTAQSTS